ncbi:hypothetical protein ACFLUC_01590 [Chloroflexota bacterium]
MFIQNSSCTNGGSIRTSSRFSHGHRSESRFFSLESSQEFCFLLRSTGRLYSGRTETTSWCTEIHANITPGKHFQHECKRLVSNWGSFNRIGIFFLFTFWRRQRTCARLAHGHVHKIDIIPGDIMLIFIKLA